jgi:hypothetical protein
MSPDTNVVLLGLGLHESLVDGFLAAARPPERMPGYAPAGESGVYECVKARTAVSDAGVAAGFELLAADGGLLNCSWLCNGLDTVCAEALGVRTNSRGFVPTYTAALRCAEYIASDEVGAEPGLWLPWLVTIYQQPAA